jgi:ornithine lipid ester-linked acyl 2-hydroxylase
VIWLVMHILISMFSRGRKAFFDGDDFPWAAALESRSFAIRAEIEALLQERRSIPNFQDVSADQAALTEGDRWKTYFLYAGETRLERNCARCPETALAIAEIPGRQSAMFSILAPGMHIPAHKGLYKGLLRYHLGLIVPEPSGSCRIRIRNEVRSWEEGKSLIFDDTYRHEAWNDSREDRVVLFVDFIRPLPFPLSRLNELVVRRFGESSFIRKMVNRIHHHELPPALNRIGQD